VDIGVVRAAFAVAETGSTSDDVVLGQLARLSVAGHLIALIDPGHRPNLHMPTRARVRADITQRFTPVPPRPADIGGVLIHGAQGVRSLNRWVAVPRRQTTLNAFNRPLTRT